MPEPLLTRYLQPLLAGRRAECFSVIREAVNTGRDPVDVLARVVWPAMSQVERLYRDDQINAAMENMAYRINRTVADQLQMLLPTAAPIGRRLLVISSEHSREEVNAEMVADLFQSRGWDVYLVGGSVPYDEIVKLLGEVRPHVLLIYGTQPPDVPNVRGMIAMLREIGVCPTMNVVVSGGVFNRADGLWQEVGADAFADNALDLVETAGELPPREPGSPRRAGLVKKRHRRRKGAPAPLHAVMRPESALSTAAAIPAC